VETRPKEAGGGHRQNQDRGKKSSVRGGLRFCFEVEKTEQEAKENFHRKKNNKLKTLEKTFGAMGGDAKSNEIIAKDSTLFAWDTLSGDE